MKEFVPSTGDEPYMQPAGSLEPIKGRKDWTNGVSAEGLSLLDSYATDINKVIDSTHKAVARAQIKVGKMLLEARGLFVGDKEFGQWRKTCTHIKSQSSANDLMRVAEKFENAPALLDSCSFSVLRELVYCPKEVVDGVKASAEVGGPTPTVAEARGMKKTSAGRPVGVTSKAALSSAPTVESQEDRYMREMHKPINKRFEHSNVYVVLGLYPFGGAPEINVLMALDEYWTNKLAQNEITEEMHSAILNAIREVTKDVPK